jgi:hypothetical protein
MVVSICQRHLKLNNKTNKARLPVSEIGETVKRALNDHLKYAVSALTTSLATLF